MAEHHPVGDAFDVQRAVSHAFAAVRLAAGPMWVAGLLMSISDGCGGGPPSSWPSRHERAHFLLSRAPTGLRDLIAALDSSGKLAVAVGVIIGIILVALVLGACLFALNCWVTTGFIRLHVNVLEHTSEELAPLFTGRDRFWPMMGYKLLAGFLVSGAAIAAAWPGALLALAGVLGKRVGVSIAGVGLMLLCAGPVLVYVALGTYLGELSVVLESASPVQALRRSFALANGNRLPLMGFAIVSWLLQIASLVGLLLCCVGALYTVPLGRALVGFAKTESFLLFTRGREQTAGWKLWQRLASEDRVERVEGWGVGRPPAPPAQ
ncbi:MAG: hypothetical protein ACHQ53_02950 [Polyangiales bacterium]